MFATEEEIEEEFFEHVGEVDYRTVHFKTGRYNRGWVKNVVAVGLSYGFIEPLEATGIATTVDNILRFMECISKRDMYYAQIDRDAFNHNVSIWVDKYRAFVDMHYYLSSRDDSKYWRYVTQDIDYDSKEYKYFLDEVIIHREPGRSTFKDMYGNSQFSGDLFLIGGMNYSCWSKPFILKDSNTDGMDKECYEFEEYLKGLNSFVKNYSSSYRYQKDTIYSNGSKGDT